MNRRAKVKWVIVSTDMSGCGPTFFTFNRSDMAQMALKSLRKQSKDRGLSDVVRVRILLPEVKP